MPMYGQINVGNIYASAYLVFCEVLRGPLLAELFGSILTAQSRSGQL